jgi:hypothetical protein
VPFWLNNFYKFTLRLVKKSHFSIKKANISQLFVLNKTYKWTTFKMQVLDQKQPILVLSNFHINAKNWSKIAIFQVDFKKKTKQLSSSILFVYVTRTT